MFIFYHQRCNHNWFPSFIPLYNRKGRHLSTLIMKGQAVILYRLIWSWKAVLEMLVMVLWEVHIVPLQMVVMPPLTRFLTKSMADNQQDYLSLGWPRANIIIIVVKEQIATTTKCRRLSKRTFSHPNKTLYPSLQLIHLKNVCGQISFCSQSHQWKENLLS